MKRRAFIFILLLVAAGGLGWVLVALHPGEPVYQGKRLSDWLGGYWPMGGSTNTWEQADEAVSHAGTRAIPTLLGMLRARDSRFKLKLIELAQKQHFVRVPFTPAANLNFAGAMGFRRLGTNGPSAVPALIKIYTLHLSDSSRAATVMALEDAAPGDVARLAEGLNSQDEEVREMIAGLLGRIRAPPALVVPPLAQCLGDTNAAVRVMAACVIAHFGPDAAAAVPALLKARQDPDAQVRTAAAYALERIDPEAAGK
jgi:hypothetical protein